MKKYYLILAALLLAVVAMHLLGGELVPVLHRGDEGLKGIQTPKFDMPALAGGAVVLTSILFWILGTALHLALIGFVVWLAIRYFRNRKEAKQSPFDAAVATLKDATAKAKDKRTQLASGIQAIDQHFQELGTQLGEINSVPKN